MPDKKRYREGAFLGEVRMEFIRTQSRGREPFELDYALIDSDGAHPQSIGELGNPELNSALSDAFERETIARLEREDPSKPMFGTGVKLYIGYDAEWTELLPGYLQCESYQFYVVGVGGELAVVCYPRTPQVEGRLGVQEMLDAVVNLARETGVIIETPKEIVLTGYFLRADLAMTKDLPSYKRKLSNIGGKLASTGDAIEFEIVHRGKDVNRLMTPKPVVTYQDDVGYVIPTRFIDIGKHAADRTPLEVIGNAIGIPKVVIQEPYRIENMSIFKAKDLENYRIYGVVDAKIVVYYWLRIEKFAKDVVGVDEAPVSAGALAVQLCRKSFVEAHLDYADLFGVEEVQKIDWNSFTGRQRSHHEWEVGGMRQFHEQFAVACFHGGRNENFAVGPSIAGRWFDFDLIGAYTTGLLVFRQIAYDQSYESSNLADFQGDVLGLAWVEYQYPCPVRFPVLPVRSETRGLIYPLAGSSYASAPEISLAVRQGCEVKIKRGVIWPWKNGGETVRIFESFVRKIRMLRERYKNEPVLEEYSKLLGNSLYGKTAQNLRAKNAFDLEMMGSRPSSPSPLTNAPIAAYVTGLIRAVIGELLHGIPLHRHVASVTTDGFATTAPPEELDLSGELCQRYLALCAMVQT